LRDFFATKPRGPSLGVDRQPDCGRIELFAMGADEFSQRPPLFERSLRHRGEYYTSVNVRLKPVWL
jgi:hypothetical protein